MLQFNPLQITDDYETYIDISSLQEEVFDQVENQDLGYKLILNNWSFIFKRVPNTHEYYFDIVADNYRLIETNTVLELDNFPRKIIDDDEIRYFYETRKRREIEDIIKRNMRIKTSPFKRNSNTATPVKSPMFKQQSATATAQIQRSPSQFSYFSPSPYMKPIFAPSQVMYSAIGQSGGVKKAMVGKQVSYDEILTVEELLDVPMFVPTIKRSVSKTPMKYNWMSQSEKVTPNRFFAGGDEMAKGSIQKLAAQYDSNKVTPSLSAKTGKNVTFTDVNEGLKSGLIKWDQIEFNRDAFNYLQKNLGLMDNKDLL